MIATPLGFQTEAERRAEKMAALLSMGFECVAGPLTTESTRLVDGRWKVAQSLPAMGTVVALTVLHDSRQLAEHAIGGSFAEMDRLIAVLNRFESNSALGVLNRDGRLDAAPDELVAVLGSAAGLHRLSGGAFDITVQPVVDLLSERHAAGFTTPPGADELREVMQRVDGTRVLVQGRDVRLQGEGMGITLDGIAKGFIVDSMSETLSGLGAVDHLVNAGGDIRAAGGKEGGAPWTVAIQDPTRGEPLPERVQLHGGAIATSGSYEIYFDQQRTWHHLVDSRSGRSPQECSSVSVKAPSVMHADALATTVFVMGPAAGTRLIESLPGCECLIVGGENQIVRSSGWQSPA